jgi:hypothetical protein
VAALLTVFATGALILFLFADLGVTGPHHRTPGAALDIAIGVVLVWVAARLRRKPSDTPKQRGPSRTERYLESRRLVLLLGVILYVLPSPIYVGAVKAIADAPLSTTQELAYLAAIVIVMLWMIEVPMLMLLAFPQRSSDALESINTWFGRHGRLLGMVAAAGAGAYLIGAGLIELLTEQLQPAPVNAACDALGRHRARRLSSRRGTAPGREAARTRVPCRGRT